MTTVGFLYPGHAAEDDYPLAERLLASACPTPPRLVVEHVYGTDLHAIAELLDLGSAARLAGGAKQLVDSCDGERPRAIVWACTSGSFVYGLTGAAEQAKRLADASGAPASSTSFGFVHAAQVLGVRRVAVAASYPDEVAERFTKFLSDAGLEVVCLTSCGIDTAAEVGQLSEADVVDLAVANDHPDAEALLIPDTAMRTFGLVGQMEQALGKPVLTANQVTVWEALRLAGVTAVRQGAGALWQAETAERATRASSELTGAHLGSPRESGAREV